MEVTLAAPTAGDRWVSREWPQQASSLEHSADMQLVARTWLQNEKQWANMCHFWIMNWNGCAAHCLE